jgi:ABC-2 type transport system permease protein
MHFIHLIRLRTGSIRSLLAERSPEKLLRFFVGFGVAVFFISFGFWFFDYVFSYLRELGDVGVLLIGRVMSLAFFAVFVLLFMSNLLTGISTIFKSRETAHLTTVPIKPEEIFAIKSLDSYLYSTWAFAVLGLPMIVAYGKAAGFELWYYLPVIVLIFIPFTMIPSALSTLILLIYFRFVKQADPRRFTLIIATVMALAFYLYLKLNSPRNLSLYTYQDWRILNDYLSGMALSSSMLFPSRWVAACLQEIGGGDMRGAAIYVFPLISSALFFYQAAIVGSRYIFERALQNSSGMVLAGNRNPILSRCLLAPLKWKYLPLTAKTRSLVYKDMALFFRDSSQWGQFSILVGLMIVYLFNLRFFPSNLSDPFWKSVVAFANFAFTGFALATLAVRFVYPTISMEGKAIWALKSAPIKTASLFWEKYAVAFAVFVVISELLALISSQMLRLTPSMAVINYAGTLIISITLTGLTIGLGAIFPNFSEKNPSKIASGAGGMLAAILSLVYICVVVVLAAYPVHLYTKFLTSGEPFNFNAFLFSFAAVIFISLIAFIIPVTTGLRCLNRLEI